MALVGGFAEYAHSPQSKLIILVILSMKRYPAAVVPLDPSLPLHDQVRRDLEREIVSGALRIGDRLPSEGELQQRYGVSRTPVRQALDRLEASGLIYRAQGRGSFVRERKIGSALRDMVSFGQELRQAGHTVRPHTLAVNLVSASASTAADLQIELGSPVIALRRLYEVDGEPLALFDHCIRPVIDLAEVRDAGDFPSLYALFAANGHELSGASEAIGAALLTAEEAGLLNVRRPAAALFMKRVSWSAADLPLESTEYRVRADRYEYQVELRRTS
jgi:GntR family transcriptional regulator